MITKFFERLTAFFTEIVYGWKTFRENNRFVDWFIRWFDWIAILSGVFALLHIFLIPIEKEQSWDLCIVFVIFNLVNAFQ